jgi:hypothetical protein
MRAPAAEANNAMPRPSGSAMVVIALLSIGSASARADDDVPSFDRPGLAFASQTLAHGDWAWEQGLPDVSTDRQQGVRTTTCLADSLLRYGFTDSLELQLGADSRGLQDVRGPDAIHVRDEGGGDARIGLKVALPVHSETFSAAVLATFAIPVGRVPIGDDGYAKDLGVSMAWSGEGGTSMSLYVDHHRGRDGTGSLAAIAYGFAVRDGLAGYVEGGFGSGAVHAREAGAGLTWMLTPRVQLDASFLRALDRATTDWQSGLGISVYFAGSHS